MSLLKWTFKKTCNLFYIYLFVIYNNFFYFAKFNKKIILIGQFWMILQNLTVGFKFKKIFILSYFD